MNSNLKLIVIGMMIAGSIASRADTVANFTGGNSTTAPDSYTGTATDPGWTSTWSLQTQSSPAASVINASPVNGGGNYLSFTEGAGAGNSSDANRTYGTAADSSFSLSTAHTISFQLRIDESASALASNFTTATDRYQVFEGGAAAVGTNATDNWIIAAYGAQAGPSSGFHAKDWLLFNGSTTDTGFTASGASWIDSGLALVSGATYSFTINTNPATKTYTASIFSSATGTTFTDTTPLNWRNYFSNPTASGGSLGFGDQANTGARAFSLDSIDISATGASSVPEPSSLALICGGLIALVCFVRRSRGGVNASVLIC